MSSQGDPFSMTSLCSRVAAALLFVAGAALGAGQAQDECSPIASQEKQAYTFQQLTAPPITVQASWIQNAVLPDNAKAQLSFLKNRKDAPLSVLVGIEYGAKKNRLTHCRAITLAQIKAVWTWEGLWLSCR
jgi:hypothetical protein